MAFAMNRKKQQFTKIDQRNGAVVVEMAICLPVLFFFFFAALEFSRVNMIRQSVENAVYEGSRRGVVPGATADDCRNAASAVLDAISVNDADIDVVPANLADYSLDVTVSIDVPINSNSWVTPFFFRDRIVSGSMTLRKERFANARVP
jgi:Flp pilus assembly protein TadG